MEQTRDRASTARALFKRFLAERWFGGPDFESWVEHHREFEPELRELRDDWLEELGDPDSPSLLPDAEHAARRAASFARDEILGGFRLTARIGSGASSEVWEAEEMALGNRRVALKLLRPDLVPDPRALERFRREAVAGSRINHPGVIAVYSVGRSHGQPFIAQELVEGGVTLATLVARQRDLGGPDTAYFQRVCELVAQAADALGAAHDLGIVHRDVKPTNILVTSGDRAKVADFGLAHLAGENVLSQTGDVMGTFSYMSPAQVRGQLKLLDGRADVFSLGATLYELLTLQRAFPGSTLQEITHKILNEDPTSAREVQRRVPVHLELLCAKALEKRIADRLPGMAEFAAELRRYLAGEPTRLKHSTLAGRALKWSRRHPTASVGGSIALVAACGLVWLNSARAEENLRARLEALHTKALYAIEMGDMREAEAWIAQADRLDDSDPTGHLILAIGFGRGGRRSEVDAQLELARARGFDDDPARLASALDHAGHALYLQSRHDLTLYPEVARHVQRALELDPRLYALEFVRFQVCNALGDPGGARSALERLQGNVRPSEPLFTLLEALLQEMRGDARAGLETLERLRSRADMTAELLEELRWDRHAGRMCLILGELARAEELLRRAVTAAPTDCSSWENLTALGLQRLVAGERAPGACAAALEDAERALECSPTLEGPYVVRAYVAELEIERELKQGALADPTRSRHWPVAADALARVQELHPGGSEQARKLESHLAYLEALPLYHRSDYARAGELYERALELDARNLRAMALLGQCFYWQGEFQPGLAVLAGGLEQWDDPGWTGERDPRWLGALLAWSLGNASELDDAQAFAGAKQRLEDELAAGRVFHKEELLSAAEFLALAPGRLRDCELAHALIDGHELRSAFTGSSAAAEAREVLEKIDAACRR